VQLLLPVAVLGGMIAILWLLSRISGWRKLATHYRATRPLEGPSFAFRSGSVGLMNYRSCLWLNADPEGFGLRNIPPFGLFDPPILIPWSELSVFVRRGWFGRATLWTKAVPNVGICISLKLAEAVVGATGRTLEQLNEPH
jgi:hypothetical protein